MKTRRQGLVLPGGLILAAVLAAGVCRGALAQEESTPADGQPPAPAASPSDAPRPSEAAEPRGGVAPADADGCTRAVWVPRMVTEVRKVPVTKYRWERRERQYTVHKCVPETKMVTRTHTVMKPVQKTKTVEYTVCKPKRETREISYTVMVRKPRTETINYTVRKPVWETKQQEYTVMVPHHETREGTRRVCEYVPVTKTRVVCRRTGHWETRTCDPCGGTGCAPACGPCARGCVRVRRCWVPEIVREEVPYTTYERRWKEVPYEYPVTACRTETRVRDVRVCRMVSEKKSKEVTRYECVPEERTRQVEYTRYVPQTKTRDIQYTEYVPETREEQVEVTSYKRVAQSKVQEYEVCVPYTEMVEKEVRVCRLVKEERPVVGCCYGYAAYGCPDDCGFPCRGAPRRCGLLARLFGGRR